MLVPSEPLQLAARAEHRFEKVETTRAALAWPIPGLTHDDAPVLDLLSMVLGSGDSSVLWQDIREKTGLVHTIDASSWNPGTSGLFCISFTADADKRVPATAAIEKTLARCATRGFTAAQLRESPPPARRRRDQHPQRSMSEGQASRLGAAEVVVGDLDYSRAYFERLRDITPADLRRVLRTYLTPGRLDVHFVKPGDVAAAPAAGPDAAAAGTTADFSEIKLPNGARLLLQPDHRLPNLHLRFIMQGGPLFEEAGKRGATALLATMLTKDTRHHSSAEVAEFIEEVGGSFYPFSGNNTLGLAIEVLPPDAARALAVLEEAVCSPAFKLTTFALERDAQVAACCNRTRTMSSPLPGNSGARNSSGRIRWQLTPWATRPASRRSSPATSWRCTAAFASGPMSCSRSPVISIRAS